MLQLITAGLAAFGLVMTVLGGPALAFDRLVVFGDSLSDSGNAGRFSNGPNWVDQMAARLGVPLKSSQAGGSNFAIGGARLDARSGPSSLPAQADLYLRQAKPAARTLHIVYGGGNDLLGALGTPQPVSAVERAITSLKNILSDLARHGATDILVPNLPDVGITPAVRARGGQALAEARALSEEYNAALDRLLAAFDGGPPLRLHRLDVYAMGERVRADPAAFGFNDVTRGCNTLRTCEGYLFWDDVHPTTRAHGHLAEAAFRAVSPK